MCMVCDVDVDVCPPPHDAAPLSARHLESRYDWTVPQLSGQR